MKFKVIPLVLVIILVCCKTDPNKQIDEGQITENTYYSKEIGWTMQIPKGWTVTQKSVSDERTQKGMEAIKESSGITYDASELKHLLNFQKNRFHVFQSTSEPFPLEYEGEWEDNNEGIKALLFETYASKGIKVDTSSSTKRIDKLDFEVFHITMYGPNGDIILYQDMYSRYINGYDFGVNLNYINDKEKDEMMGAWLNSKFNP